MSIPTASKINDTSPEHILQGLDSTLTLTIGLRMVSRTDISKIIRKPSKTGKHGHEERKSTKEAKDSKPKPRKVNS
ncbi:hypothetical protein Tco_1287085 [Tanacetum coccineum]